MFRWLALCLVLCAGAVALVALATGSFFPQATGAQGVDPTPPDQTVQDNNDGVKSATAATLGSGGAIIINGARLTAEEREEVPSQRDGTMLIVGTDVKGDAAQPGDMVARFPFLALEIDDKDKDHPVDPQQLPPENQWLFLVPSPGSKFKEAVSQERAGDHWNEYKNSGLKVYRRWQEGDPLEPNKVEVAFEQKKFHKLTEGDWVKKDQLLALVDPTVQVNDVSSKIAKMETAEADYRAAVKTKLEAIRRASSAELLWSKGKGYISEDDYQAALLNRDRYIEEEKSKDAARKVASEELSAAISILKLHEIRASLTGVVKVVYKHRGESVKNLDPVVQIQNPLKLRVEGLADVQNAQNLVPGMPVIIEPNRPAPAVARFQGHQAEVTSVAVSRPGANGKKLILSASEDGDVRFWDWTANQPLVGILSHHAGVLAVACTGPKAARNLALTGDRDGVGRLIDLDHLLPAPAAAPAPAADGAAAGDAAALAQEAPAQTAPIKLAERHKGPITCVAFSPDGALCATGGEDRTIRLWNAENGKQLHTLYAAHKAAVTSLQFAKEEGEGKSLQLVSAGGDNTLIVWNLDKIDAPVRSAVFPYRSGDVARLGVSDDGKYVLFDHGDEMRVLSLEDRQIVGVIQSSGAGVNFTTFARFAPDGNTVLTNCASDGRLQLWRTPGRLAAEGQGRAAELRQFIWNSGTATCAAFDPDEKQPAFVVTGSKDNFVLVWAMPKADEVLAKPRETKLTLVERSLDSGSRQVRVWAEINNDDWAKGTGLTPGGTATMVVPPQR